MQIYVSFFCDYLHILIEELNEFAHLQHLRSRDSVGYEGWKLMSIEETMVFPVQDSLGALVRCTIEFDPWKL